MWIRLMFINLNKVLLFKFVFYLCVYICICDCISAIVQDRERGTFLMQVDEVKDYQYSVFVFVYVRVFIFVFACTSSFVF